MLQGLQASDHRLHAGAHLLVLLHERGTLTGQRFMPGTQRTVLLAQLLERRQQIFQALGETSEFLVELCSCSVAHGPDYRAALFPRSIIMTIRHATAGLQRDPAAARG